MPTPPFMIAVDDQPSTILVKDAQGRDQRLDNFARWKARGVDTLYRSQKDEPLAVWSTLAAGHGLRMIPTVPFMPDGTVDVVTIQMVEREHGPYVIGWTFEDEADRRSAIRPNPPITFARMQMLCAQARAATTKPIYLTFTGGGGGFDNADYKGDAAGQAAIGGPGHRPPGWFALPDVIVWDYHLWASGRPELWYIHDRMQDRAHEWSGGKPQLIYAECSPQNVENKGRPGPSLPQWREIHDRRLARAKEKGHNLAGFIEFPQRVAGGFNFDATPDDIAAAMPGYFASIRPAPSVPPVPEAPPPAPQAQYLTREDVQAMFREFNETKLRPLSDAQNANQKLLGSVLDKLKAAGTVLAGAVGG